MPVLDTPITTDERNLKKVLGQKQPAVILLYDGSDSKYKPLHDALKRVAKQHSGDLLAIKVDVRENPQVRAQYDNPELPALVTLTKAFFGRSVKSTAENVRPADIRAHVDHLMNDTPLPEVKSSEPAAPKTRKSKEITDQIFRREVLQSKTPVIVDFFAVWCGPCQTIAPFMDQMAEKYSGKVKVVKLNTDRNPSTAGRYGIQSIPTFILFDGGQPVQRFSGASPRAIEQMIQQVAN